MDNISKKQAPKRDVVDIVREGEWGKVVYRHRLSCGHTETRKRVAPAAQMACTWCVVAEQKNSELRALMTPPKPERQVVIDVADIIDTNSSDLVQEQHAMRLQGGLSARLRIPADAIDVVLEDVDGELRVSYALVFLSAADARRIADEGNQRIVDI